MSFYSIQTSKCLTLSVSTAVRHLTAWTLFLCSIDIAEDGHSSLPKFIDALTVDWPEKLQQLIMKAFENELTIFEMTRANYAASAVYAEATNALLAKAGIEPEEVDVLGYDGQTVYQEPLERKRLLNTLLAVARAWLTFG